LGDLIHPFILYALCVLGGAGLYVALPKGGRNPQVLGAMAAALVGGIALLVLGLKLRPHLPNVYFYVFALIGVGAALRVITHPRPVYAALYFILTVISTGGLFVLLSAEFMAFALIIVYAGAILITYLFVIMLATQAPEEDQTEVLADYDTQAREPLAATVVGFLLLALLSTMLFRGVHALPPAASGAGMARLDEMPRKVETALRTAGLMRGDESLADAHDHPAVDAERGVITVKTPQGATREIPRRDWPEALAVSNVESLGFNLLRDHPGSIEIAGVILLMAMLGAVVLSRKQVEIDEEAKRRQALKLGQTSPEVAGEGAA
jgi:NADH-quinone oxidoreductase subunit J